MRSGGVPPFAKIATVESQTFYGNHVRSRVAGRFVITESLFRHGSALPTHAHDLAYLTFTLTGSYRERYGQRWRLCTPGTSVAHPALEPHSQIFGGENTLLLRIVPLGMPGRHAFDLGLDEPAQNRCPLATRVAWQLHQELDRYDDFSDRIIEELAYELTSRALHRSALAGGSRKRAVHAGLLIRSSLRAPLSTAAIAIELGVSRATLYRDFRSTFRKTPSAFAREARLDAAAAALRSSTRPIADIAADCGFYDQSHFDRSFRIALGVSPSEYRRSAR